MTEKQWIDIDGSQGEGGGQILRTSLGLSLVTGRPLRMERIRAGRGKPGLLRQHLAAVRAARELSGGRVEGEALGSQTLRFEPGAVRPGEYHFAVGSAGSATLVFQTVLPALLRASGPTRLTLEGGTHNPWAPPFDFLVKAFFPLVERLGPRVRAHLERPGFFPVGAGRFTVEVEPAGELTGFDLMDRGEPGDPRGLVVVANLPAGIGRRELRACAEAMGWSRKRFTLEQWSHSRGPGNALMLELPAEHCTEVFTAFGRKGVKAEAVGREVAEEARAYLDTGAPVGEHLADQLVLLLALAGRGRFRTGPPSGHLRTQLEVIPRFLPVDCSAEVQDDGTWLVEVGPGDRR